MTVKKAAKKASQAPKKAAPKAAERVCAYGDRNPVVATRETPRGPQFLCEHHKASVELLGHETKAVR